PDCFRSDVCLRSGTEADCPDLAAVAQRMDFRPCRSHLYWLCRAVSELWREPAVSGAGAGAEVKAFECAYHLAAAVADDCRDRLSFAALRFSLYDAGPGGWVGAGHREVWAAVLLRSQDFAVVHHVGGVHAAAVHPLEFGMAWPPRGLFGNLRFRSGAGRVGR